MTESHPELDLQSAHRHFAADCFNRAWVLMDKAERTPEQQEEMLRLSHTSLWHWTQRDDYSPTKASVGYWQLSRIYVLLGQPEGAARYGELSLRTASGPSTPPFYRAYAHEALSRAAALAGNWAEVQRNLDQARKVSAKIEDESSRAMLLADLDTIAVVLTAEQ